MTTPLIISTQLNLLRIPVLGIVIESGSTPPSTPVAGQLWLDTSLAPPRIKGYENGAWVLLSQTGSELTANKGAAGGYASLDGTTKVPIAQIPTGSSSTTVLLGNTSLDAIAQPIAAVSMNSQRLTNLALATSATDAVSRTFLYNTSIDLLAQAAGDYSMNSHRMINLGTPVSANDAARLIDVQNAQAGIDLKPSVRAASTGNVSVSTGLANGQVVDGVTLVTGDRVLLKNQTDPTQNGSYIAPATGIAARSSDTINANSMWLVEEGTANADTSWMVTTNNPITLGTTSLTIAQFGAGGTTYSGTANRITVSGTVIDIAATYVGQTSITTLGTITSGTWTGTPIAVANGGTGATSASSARTNLGAVGKYSATLGALIAGTELTITHNLGTTDVQTMFRDASTNYQILFGWRIIDSNTIGVTSDVAYSASSVRVVVMG